jgi:anti-sigma-K factor RskA
MSAMDRLHITSEQADEFAIGSLPTEEERLIALHIMQCDPCRDVVRTSERVAASLAMGLQRRPPPPRLKRRTLVGAGIARPGLLRRASVYARAAAGVAAVFVAIAAFTGMVSVRGQIQGLRNENVKLYDQIDSALSQKVEIAAVSQRLTEEERTTRELRFAARGDRDLLIALLSPESDAAEVVSTDQSSRAIGRLVWDEEQKRVWFVANRLPSRADGEVYQIWVSSGGRYISLGTFNSDTSGYARYETTVPQGLKSYDGAVVTIERGGGAVERSGPSVFVTDLSRLRR